MRVYSKGINFYAITPISDIYSNTIINNLDHNITVQGILDEKSVGHGEFDIIYHTRDLDDIVVDTDSIRDKSINIYAISHTEDEVWDVVKIMRRI